MSSTPFWWQCVGDIDFPGILKKELIGIPGVNQKRSGIARGVHEKLMWSFYGF